MTSACLPRASWLSAMASLLSRIFIVAGVALRRSVPMISGAFMTDQRLKWVRHSVSVIPPLPTSSMSGSFHPPFSAYDDRGAFCRTMLLRLAQLSLMSPVVRHRWLIDAPQVQGWLAPHSHSE